MPLTDFNSAVTGQGLDYNVDIVMCIDATGSMAPIINSVKEHALSFHEKFKAAMQKENKDVTQLRIKVIVFRDFEVDSEPLLESKFFVLDDEREEFAAFVNNITPEGGGDNPESGLEALAQAIKSDWVRTGAVRRHVIVLYSDTSAKELGSGSSSPAYPADMPKDFSELRDIWDGQMMEARAKRMLLFTPDAMPWNDIQLWNNAFLFPMAERGGCSEADMEVCLRALVHSI